MPLTDAQLQGIAMQALNMAKLDLERDRFNFLFAAYHQCDQPGLQRMDKVEQLIIEHLGENWLNSGKAKDVAFGLLRRAVDLMPPDAVVFATAANGFKETAKFRGLSAAQRRKLIDEGHDGHHRGVAAGYFELQDLLMATVQTPERVCFCRQGLDRYREFIGQPEVHFGSQEEFGGRLKMFGEDDEARQKMFEMDNDDAIA